MLPDDLRPGLHAYLGGILRDLGGTAVEINSEPDHVHLLFLASRAETLSDVVGQLKTGSNLWLQEQRPELHPFHWQNGYGAFSVSPSAVEDVRDYIRRQREHHRMMTFQDEYRKFLVKHGIEFDERHVWD
ncbi:transposase [Prosthecobacter sp.]|uniref:transposase n=1 Tax=Prosthecobacter sp. TaxID=1965333 RepID=UPI002AB9FD45|nr:transposase [Prosthecobacter sp.]MDZ4403348.1 transposase [Prosthecobacter sp.]